MAKMSKPKMRKRLFEAATKVDKVFSGSLLELSGTDRSKLIKISMDLMNLRKKLK